MWRFALLFFILSSLLFSEISEKEFVSKLEEHIPMKENALVGWIDFTRDHPIDQSTFLKVKFSLEDFKKRKVDFIVLHLNTPGGEVMNSLKIVDLLQKVDKIHGIPVIAYIDSWAVSAGALCAYACRYIVTTNKGIMGAAEPVTGSTSGEMKPASEKVKSALRAEFSSVAKYYGRNPLIAQAMVDQDLILVLRGGEVVQLEDDKGLQQGDTYITRGKKLLTLTAEEMRTLDVADAMVESGELSEASTWPFTQTALYKLPYLDQFKDANVIRYRDWKTGFFSFLSHPIVASILTMGMIIGFYIEINTPGFGIFGGIAVACLALILLSSFAVHIISWIEILILCLGVILLLLEFFVIPGFGIAGILGIALTLIGLFALMLPGIGKVDIFDFELVQFFASGFLERLAYLCGAIILSAIVIAILWRFLPRKILQRRKIVLKGEQEKALGYTSGIPESQMPKKGSRGRTLTSLRPSGKVSIDDQLFDAVTLGGYIDKDVEIEVYKVEGSKVIVRKIL